MITKITTIVESIDLSELTEEEIEFIETSWESTIEYDNNWETYYAYF